MNAFKINISSTSHNDYGLGYPVTYKFAIPATAVNLTAWKKTSLTGGWSQLPEKTTADFFNGIEAVRFDYTNDFAYASVAFGSDSDDIFFQLKDVDEYPVVDVSFVSICEYYDNRKAVVTLTADDFYGGVTADTYAMNETRARKIWLTGCLQRIYITTQGHWDAVQNGLDLGYLEAANHSWNHQELPYDDYDLEINGSKQSYIDNLDLPAIYKKGATEYIPLWSEPYGTSDATVRTMLGQYKYLCDRNIDEGVHVFATWDASNGLYNRIGYSNRLDNDIEVVLNDSFDARYAAGGIYHLMLHSAANDWSVGKKTQNHLDYIKDKKDVWYVGFGALYMYHYVQERDKVSVSIYDDTSLLRIYNAFHSMAFQDKAGINFEDLPI